VAVWQVRLRTAISVYFTFTLLFWLRTGTLFLKKELGFRVSVGDTFVAAAYRPVGKMSLISSVLNADIKIAHTQLPSVGFRS